MSIEAMKQTLDLSTPTLREMVTRHAAAIDPRATLEDMPEALAFQIDMARALLKEFTAIQQEESKTDEPVAWISKTGHGVYYRQSITPELASLEHGGNKMWRPLVYGDTHPAPGVPDAVVRDAKRWHGVVEAVQYIGEHPVWTALCEAATVPVEPTKGAVDAAVDAAMLTAAQAQKGGAA